MRQGRWPRLVPCEPDLKRRDFLAEQRRSSEHVAWQET
jgi:hypothetical protein